MGVRIAAAYRRLHYCNHPFVDVDPTMVCAYCMPVRITICTLAMSTETILV